MESTQTASAPQSPIVAAIACLHCGQVIEGQFVHLTAIDRYLHASCYRAAREWFRDDNAKLDAYYARQVADEQRAAAEPNLIARCRICRIVTCPSPNVKMAHASKRN